MQRRQAGHTLAGVVELGRPGEHPQQPGVGAGGVRNLPDPVQRLVARVLAHAQDGLRLVDDDDEPAVPSGLDDLQHPAQVVERVPALDVALHPCCLLGRGGDVAAAAEPGDERPGLGQLAALLQVENRLHDADEVRGCLATGQGRQILVEPMPYAVVEAGAVLAVPGGEQGLLHPADPAVQDVAQGTTGTEAGAELAHYLAVDVVEAMEAQIVVGHHDEAGREAEGLGVQHGEARHEGLAAAVAAAQELDRALPARRQLELALHLPALLLDADREGVEAALWNEALA